MPFRRPLFVGLLLLVALPCVLTGVVPLAFSEDVLTYHYNNQRTGLDSSETTLTLANVNSTTFGKLFTLTVDGKVDAQPLYLSAVPISGKGTHNLLIVATENDSVYAFDADAGTLIWQATALLSGETASDDRSCTQITPKIGITATPVISRPSGSNGVIYVAAMSKDSSGNYHQRLHALNAATGKELYKGPVEISAQYPGTGDNSSGGNVIFDPAQYVERSALLLVNNVVYVAWASHCDIRPYTGWIMGYDATTLAQSTVLNVTPNGNSGAIWGSGAGLTADTSGNIFSSMPTAPSTPRLLPEDFQARAITAMPSSGSTPQAVSPSPITSRCGTASRKVRTILISAPAAPFYCPTCPMTPASCSSLSVRARIPIFTSSTATTWENSTPTATSSIRNWSAPCPAASGPCPPTSTARFISDP